MSVLGQRRQNNNNNDEVSGIDEQPHKIPLGASIQWEGPKSI